MSHATTQTRVSAPRLPQPAHKGLFREPVYADGAPYGQDNLEDDEPED
ncbi:hypothetical protein [Streptomyces kaempferi]|uniref:Uncharacterized protein n=1 Tax=Streptomyces kaempferi TaxID=333725 RepID=A0ABW3XHL4_9ACTN